MLKISLLGEFRLIYGDNLVHSINTPRLRSLLAYFLLHRGTALMRHQLAFLFWPDSSEAQARTNLRKVLYQLRQALPDSDTYLNLQGQTVQWQEHTSYSLDVEEEKVVATWEREPGQPQNTRVALSSAISLAKELREF